jgi:hypothetical protein
MINACASGRVACVKEMIEHGADVERTDDIGQVSV